MNRIIKIEGVANFRHMGGYKTRFGTETRDDRLYRCGHLFDISDAGRQELARRNVSQVIDFRSDPELKERPVAYTDHWQPLHIANPIGGNAAAWVKDIFRRMAESDDPAQELYDQFILAFRTIPIRNRDGIKRFFDSLIDGPTDAAAIFHCTAGKDRTGITGALFLTALGVPKDDVMENFMATNAAVDLTAKTKKIVVNIARHTGTNLKPEDVTPVAGVFEDFLDNAFTVMADEFGSVDRYITDGLDIKGERLERLQTRFTRS